MHNANIPDHTELPSTSKLIKSTMIAIIAAAVILVTLVLPAEFGIDPTGVGKLTGLKRMGEIKTALAKEFEESKTTSELITDEITTIDTPPVESQTLRTDERSVTLAPNQSIEIKLVMVKGDKAEFHWSTDTGQVFYDLHGDSIDVDYYVYEKGTEATKQGTFEAAFTGNHGWYWKNRNLHPITIILRTTGNYKDIKILN